MKFARTNWKTVTVNALALATLGVWLGAARAARRSGRSLSWLDDARKAGDDECPALSVIVPACNEAAVIEPAMRSLLAIDYPHLEIIAVNDRSTDDTGIILERLANDHTSPVTALNVCTVKTLPPGWLGKNHALATGAAASRGEFLLFTDADVVFRPDALRRAAAAALDRKADHLVVAPGVILTGFWERLLVCYFAVMFSLRCRTWEIDDPDKPDSYIGIGAFNMVRRSAYDAIGGHERLRLEVADDLKLGKLLKQAGFRQLYVLGGDPVKVRWVEGLSGFVNGLTKNFFAGLEYEWTTVIGVTLFIGVAHILPAPGLFWGTRFSRLCCAGAMAAMMVAVTPPRRPESPVGTRWPDELSTQQRALQGAWERTARTPWALFALCFPLAAGVWLYTMWRSAVLTEKRGGVEWRGTFYRLEDLKKGVV